MALKLQVLIFSLMHDTNTPMLEGSLKFLRL